MSNKEFEDKVLKALGKIETDVSGLKTDVSELKTDVSELKIQMVKLDDKIDTQTYDLKQTMNVNTAYLDQAFNQISRIDWERFAEKNNIQNVSYV